jgi:hypothetical protein
MNARIRAALSLVLIVVLVGLAWPRSTPRFPLHTLLEPLAIDQTIPGVPGGFVLGMPQPGVDEDLVFLAMGPTGRVELHLLDRGQWPEAAHTPSFDVGYEVFGTNVPAADAVAVRDAVARAIAANDPGMLHVDQLAWSDDRTGELDKAVGRWATAGTDSPVAVAAPTAAERVLDRLRGTRAVIAGVLLLALGALLAPSPLGRAMLILLLGGLGFWLRATSLDLPFAFDADVQRLFTAHLPLDDVVKTAVFEDRHPPLNFLLLHAMEHFGESESVVRLPAVIAGTLLGPVILLAAWWLRGATSAQWGPRSLLAVSAALAATAAPVFVARSREVSELTLFGLLAVITAAASLYASDRPTRSALWLVALGHACLLWTYYLAAFVLLGFWLTMLGMGKVARDVGRAAVLGSLIGLPSVAFAGGTLLRDYPLREIARFFPHVVWGEQSVGNLAGDVGSIVLNGLGVPLLLIIALITVTALVSRDRTVLAPIAAAAAAVVGMFALVGVARLQAYYVVSVLPLLPLALALCRLPADRRAAWAWAALLALPVAASVPHLLASENQVIYPADPAAFGRRFAEVISARPESRIALAFAPDSTLLAYSLARAAGIEIDWHDLDIRPGLVEVARLQRRFIPLVQASSVQAGSGQAGVATLTALAQEGDFLAVADRPPSDPDIDAWLQRCTELDRTPVRRLLHCSGQG